MPQEHRRFSRRGKQPVSQELGSHPQRPVKRLDIDANRIRPHHANGERAGVGNAVVQD